MIFIKSVIIFVVLFLIDQYIKIEFVNGLEFDIECITFSVVYNYGVAFSMFEFLEGNLKFIQLGLLGAGTIYLMLNSDVFKKYYLPIALIYAGGLSNIYDRFIHGGVVDYVYWHCWFDFAVFNLADVIIDIAIVLIFYIQFRPNKPSGKQYNFD